MGNRSSQGDNSKYAPNRYDMTDGYAHASATTHDTLAIPMSLSELEQYLFRAADLLRGSIDQADFKAYIFPLMFFKRISDVYAEEYERALVESGGDHEYASFAENHRFGIPTGSLWEDVRARTENVGQALVIAVAESASSNSAPVSMPATSRGCRAWTRPLFNTAIAATPSKVP